MAEGTIVTAEQIIIDEMRRLTDGYSVALHPDRIPEYIDLILECSAHGGTDDKMAACLGVSKSEMKRFARDHIQFRDALAFARTVTVAWRAEAMRVAAVDPTSIDYKMVYRMYDKVTARDDQGDPVQKVWKESPPSPVEDGDGMEEDGVAVSTQDTSDMGRIEAQKEIERLLEQKILQRQWVKPNAP